MRPFPCTGKLSSCEAGHERPATARKAPPTQGAPRYRHPPARPNEDLSSSHAPGPPGRSSRGRHRAGADDTTQDRPPLRASRSRSRKAAAARARDARLEELKAESAHRARSPVTPSAVWADGRHSLYRVSSGAVIGNIEVSEVVKVRALGSDRGSSRGALSVPRGALAEMMPGVRVRPPCRRRCSAFVDGVLRKARGRERERLDRGVPPGSPRPARGRSPARERGGRERVRARAPRHWLQHEPSVPRRTGPPRVHHAGWITQASVPRSASEHRYGMPFASGKGHRECNLVR